MRSLLLTIFMPIAIIWGLTQGIRGILVFNWLTFMRPQDFVWSFWSSQPMFRYGLIVMAISAIMHRAMRFRMTPFLALYCIFYLWMLVTTYTSASYKISMEYFKSYIMITPVAFFIITWVAWKLQDVYNILWVIAGSVSLITLKVTLSMLISGNLHLSSTTSGFVGDNNTLALCICLCTGIMMGLRVKIVNKYLNIFIIIMVISNIFLILVTQSRGAFLTLGIVALISVFSSKRPILYLFIALVIIGIGYISLPKEMFTRLDTLENVESDESAMSRVDMWKRAMLIAEKRPITGIGVGCFRYFNSVVFPGQPNFVTHSVYFQVLSSTGYPGLILYIGILLYTVFSLNSSYSFCSKNKYLHDQLNWAAQTAFWMRNVLIGYIFGSAFLDMLIYDIPNYFMLYSSLLKSGINFAASPVSTNDHENVPAESEEVCQVG